MNGIPKYIMRVNRKTPMQWSESNKIVYNLYGAPLVYKQDEQDPHNILFAYGLCNTEDMDYFTFTNNYTNYIENIDNIEIYEIYNSKYTHYHNAYTWSDLLFEHMILHEIRETYNDKFSNKENLTPLEKVESDKYIRRISNKIMQLTEIYNDLKTEESDLDSSMTGLQQIIFREDKKGLKLIEKVEINENNKNNLQTIVNKLAKKYKLAI